VRLSFLLTFLATMVAARPVAAQATPQRVVRALDFRGNRALDDLTLQAFIATSESGWAARWWGIRWLGLGEKQYLDETELRRDVVRLILIYRQAGYMAVTVDTLIRRDAGDAFVTFVIHEGEPVRVRRFDLLGLEGLLDTARLRRELPLRAGDPFDRSLLQASADTIAGRLRRTGYPFAEVLRNFDADAESLRADIALEAVPGPRMRVGSVRVEGLERVSLGTVRRLTPVREGQWYSDQRLARAQRELYDLGAFRYVDVQLADTTPPAAPEDTTVSVVVRLAEGTRNRVRAGLGYATEECLRAQAGWTVGNFLGGGRILDLSARAGMIGVGYPTADLGIGGPLCGTLVDDFTADTVTYSLGASVRQAGFPGLAHATSVGLFSERRAEPSAYVRESHGVNVGVTFNARTRGPVAVTYSYSLGSTAAPPGVYCSVFQACTEADQDFLAQQRPFAGIAVTGVRRRTDAILDPTIGSFATATWLASTTALGSDPLLAFNRGEAAFSSYHRVGRRGVVSWRVWGGAILPKVVRTSSDTARYVPPEHRFYAGGPNSVRGYTPNGLGPLVYVTSDLTAYDSAAAANGDTIYTDLRVSPTGGSTALVANVELRIPSPVVSSRMFLTFFLDAGQVWDKPGTMFFSVSDLRITPGVGLRFVTPLGPVRVEAGYNGYERQAGPLYLETPDSIVRVRESYSTPRPTSFFRRLTLQFAVGPTF
jgi:outer membrane protein insertion porin family/translocation and assembly module TamA